jgi:hypothetical protein
MTLNQLGGSAEGVPDRRQHPICGVACSLERRDFTSESGTLLRDTFDQLAALPLTLNQAFSHDRWLP